MAAPKLYDPSQMVLTWGKVEMQAYEKGSMIKVEYDEDAFKASVGGTGEVTRVYNPNRMAKITFRLQRTSPTNARLYAIAKQDRLSKDQIYPAQVKDLVGGQRAHAPNAWLSRAADQEHAHDDATAIEWVLICDELEME